MSLPFAPFTFSNNTADANSLADLVRLTQQACIVANVSILLAGCVTVYDLVKTFRIVSTVASRRLGVLKNLIAAVACLFCTVCTVSAFSSANQVCGVVVHIVGLSYPLCKFGSYLFLFGKSRLVRPLVAMNLFERALLAATSLIVPFAVCCGIWVQGALVERNHIDGATNEVTTVTACFPRVPPALAIVMMSADVLVSIGYIALFVEPLYNKAFVEVRFHGLIMRNLIACLATIIGTAGAMVWIVLCDYNTVCSGDIMRVTIFCGGVLDLMAQKGLWPRHSEQPGRCRFKSWLHR
jgi:hypothetical protein